MWSTIEGKGDLGYVFRMQNNRSMHEVDQLLAQKLALKKALGEEKSAAIEACPEDYADADAFRIYHAKARFRATFTTIGVMVGAPTIAAKYLGMAQNGRQLLRRYSMFVAPAIVGTWLVSYKIHHFGAGFTNQENNELLYARNVRMMRNLQIKA